MVEIKNKFLYELSLLKESEDHIEFKETKRDFDYNGGSHKENRQGRLGSLCQYSWLHN